MRNFHHKGLLMAVFVALVFFSLIGKSTFASNASSDNDYLFTARPSVNGRLHVQDNRLVDEKGQSVLLRCLSTHGLTWFPDVIDENLFGQISNDWNCSLIRLAMYSDVYCNGEKEESLRLMKKGISAAIAADMYVIVDWHVLEDNNPNINKEEAKEFFEIISSEFSDYPNLIFEICNEPNGTTEWNDIVNYSEEVIPIIRNNIPDSVILVGTPNYDRELNPAIF